MERAPADSGKAKEVGNSEDRLAKEEKARDSVVGREKAKEKVEKDWLDWT